MAPVEVASLDRSNVCRLPLRVLCYREHRPLAHGTGPRSGPRSRSVTMAHPNAPGSNSASCCARAYAVSVPAPQRVQDERSVHLAQAARGDLLLGLGFEGTE